MTNVGEPVGSKELWLRIMREELSELYEEAQRGGALGLAEGLAGYALAVAEYGYATGTSDAVDIAARSARHALEMALDGEAELGLFTGLAGIAFADHAIHSPRGTVEMSLQRSALTVLRDAVLRRGDTLDIDLIYGLAGIAVYLARLPGEPLVASLLCSAVEVIERRATMDGPFMWWPIAAERVSDGRRGSFPSGYIDLAVAHGSAGIAGAMALVAERVPPIDTSRIMRPVVAHLLRYRETGIPAYIDLVSGKSATGQLSWCYGELASALCVARALAALEERDSLSILVDHYSVATMESNDIIDPGLCHGAAGILHLLRCAPGMYERSRRAVESQCRQRIDLSWKSVTMKPGLLDGRAGLALASGSMWTNITGWRDLFLIEPCMTI